MTLRIHPGVRRDAREILDWYDRRSVAAADRFHAELLSALEEIGRNPERHHFIAPRLRRLNLASFPYHVVYSVRSGVASVLVLRHHGRHPGFGLRRRW